MRSPKGGRPLAHVSFWAPLRERKATLSPLHVSDNIGPNTEGDYSVWHVGYCGGCGEKMLVRRSTAEYLHGLLDQEFG